MVNSYPFIVLFHHILGTILVVFSLKFSTTVIFYRNWIINNAKMSPVLIYFFIFTIFWSISLLIHKLYSIAYWRPIENEYNAFILYWTGFFPQIFVFVGTVFEFFLCIDRCLSILFPIKYSLNFRKYYGFATLFGVVIYITVFLFLNNLFNSIPNSSVSNCLIFGCFLNNLSYLTTTKYVTVSINFLSGCILFLVIKTKFKSGDQKNRHLSNTVLIIILTSTFADIFPTFLSSYFSNVHNIRLNDVIGPFSPTLTSINITISTWLYSRAFRRTFKLSPVKIGIASVTQR